ncbi:hypothetical protein WG922_14825 [Ramlibacter sp. AN1015]|uniref:hypothetical protein n=1 Tax=Ramlibacter sp. AN1015 TaxID=3133428 RepID=UPI0030BC9E08
MTGERHPDPARLPEGAFDGRSAFQQMVRDALARAASEGWQELILSDPDFLDWPLGERAVAASLQAWSARGRRITLLAGRWDAVVRHHARFVAWRRTWSDIVEARTLRGSEAGDLPSALWTPGWMMQRHDLERCSGRASHDAVRRHALREELAESQRGAAPGFPATTLGL